MKCKECGHDKEAHAWNKYTCKFSIGSINGKEEPCYCEKFSPKRKRTINEKM